MKNKENLIKKLLSGDISKEELRKLNEWYDSFDSEKELTIFSKEDITTDELKKKMYSKIENSISANNVITSKSRSINYKSNYYGIAAAAVILILLGSITLFLNLDYSGNEIPQYVEKFNPKGKRSKLTLAEGTQIWLNAESKIKIPKKFSDKKREVVLEGEAFFEVTEDVNRPFIVKTDNVMTTVLGTSFNVKAYENTATIVTVTDGKVKVNNSSSSTSNPDEYFLQKDDQILIDAITGKIEKTKIVSTDYSSWKDGILVFDKQPLAEVTKTLEREFNVEIILMNEKLDSCILHGKYQGEKLDNILKSISYALNVEYNYTDKGITITGEGCN